MSFTNQKNAMKIATASKVFWSIPRLSWGPQGLKMCDSRFLGMGEIELCRGMGIGI